MKLKINNKKITIIKALDFKTRLIGLMGKKNIDYGILFPNCNAIHTFLMQENIDVLGLNDDNQVIGMVRACDIVELVSELYDIKVSKLYEAMQNQLRGVSWEELMAASALVSQKSTGVKISPEDYEANIMDSTFGEAIWSTGGLEKFFAGLISVGELVLARRVGKSRR